jgi:hypothetical protein
MRRDRGGGTLRRLHTPGGTENRRQPTRPWRDSDRQLPPRKEKSAPLFHIPAQRLGHPCGPSAHVAGDDKIVAVPVEPAHFIGSHHLGEYGRIPGCPGQARQLCWVFPLARRRRIFLPCPRRGRSASAYRASWKPIQPGGADWLALFSKGR